MTSRYLGLIVVPGEHIRKIELEEFASQMKEKMQGYGSGIESHGGSAGGKGISTRWHDLIVKIWE